MLGKQATKCYVPQENARETSDKCFFHHKTGNMSTTSKINIEEQDGVCV